MNRSLILPSSYLSTHSDFCRLYYELRLDSKLFAGLLLSLILSLVDFFFKRMSSRGCACTYLPAFAHINCLQARPAARWPTVFRGTSLSWEGNLQSSAPEIFFSTHDIFFLLFEEGKLADLTTFLLLLLLLQSKAFFLLHWLLSDLLLVNIKDTRLKMFYLFFHNFNYFGSRNTLSIFSIELFPGALSPTGKNFTPIL